MPTVCFLEIVSGVLETGTKVGYDYLWKGLVILVWLKIGGFDDDTEKLLQRRHYLVYFFECKQYLVMLLFNVTKK